MDSRRGSDSESAVRPLAAAVIAFRRVPLAVNVIYG